eukprot:9766330-Alexandrium_andersonii.AAC.1
MPAPQFARVCRSLTVEGAGASEVNGDYVDLGARVFYHRTGTSCIWWDRARSAWYLGSLREPDSPMYSALGTHGGGDPPTS